MNERIEKLLVEAHTQTKGGIYSGHPSEVFEKFAELIVRECISKCEEVAVNADAMSKSRFLTDAGRMLHEGMWGGAKNCSGQIKQHFGVE